MTSIQARKVLLAVSGMSPQIITETLYALIKDKNWLPDAIWLITTRIGKENAMQHLLEGPRHFNQLMDDLQITQPIRFTEDQIILIEDAQGHELSDLRTPQDNEAAADTICAAIQQLTADDDTELHVSLAGGRKTMGFYAGYALSLFGRSQDCLSHVLVSEHYESHPDFFYPTPHSRLIKTRDGRSIDSRDARVWLAEIPFVRLRNRLPETLLKGTHSFSETVRLARQATENIRLTLYPKSQHYQVNDQTGALNALHMSLLLWVVTRALQQQPPIEPVVESEQRPADELLALAEHYWLSLPSRTEDTLKRDGITQRWLEQNISRLNHALADTLGIELAERCKLASRVIDGRRAYTLPDDIELSIDQQNPPQP
ncbi:MAG: CRISPR-associated ring nuclease Csm6 [Gammaproteobacteria bacterium]|nr:CRISPR-associated ring nuclease Csm6 [Gammaproteobacteria bacterium]